MKTKETKKEQQRGTYPHTRNNRNNKERSIQHMLRLGMIAMALVAIIGNGNLQADAHGDKKGKDIVINSSASKLKWKGSKIVGGSHSGTIDIKSGVLRQTKQGFNGKIVMDMTTLTATDVAGGDRKDLNAHLKSDDFFSVKKYPSAQLEITKAKLRKGNIYDVSGKLTIKGTTKNVTFPAKVVFDNKKGTLRKAAGTMVFDRTEFGVKYNSKKFFPDLGDKLLKDEITIVFRLKS